MRGGGEMGSDGMWLPDDLHHDRPLALCPNEPTDQQTRKARKRFGEGFTWTCPSCGQVLVLTQGKGSRWFWTEAAR